VSAGPAVGSIAVPRIVPFGERAWLLEIGDDVDVALSERVLAIAATIDERRASEGLDAIAPAVPAYASVLVAFDPRRIGSGTVRALLEAAVAAPSRAASVARPPDVVEIPVRYGGADGPDLEEVARRLGLTPAAVVDLHAATTYRVFMLGFAPGFAYLGSLPPELRLPRRATPRTSVPAGSVAIAARQTAVYPVATPGGWHLIGRTAERLWDPTADPPARLAPGDRVRFVPT
jgi:KipI family sensor histidine kinase inhibitor